MPSMPAIPGKAAGGAGRGLPSIPGKSAMPAGGGAGRGMPMPGMMGMPGMGRGGAGRGGSGPAAAPLALPKPAAPKMVPKKSDWIKVNDPSSGQDYFYNEKTQESSWDQPPGFVG